MKWLMLEIATGNADCAGLPFLQKIIVSDHC